MRILLDECIPRNLKMHLASHDCVSVPEAGWTGVKNGELLNLAERAGFQLLLTLDGGIEYQQNLTARRISILLIGSKSNRLADLQPLVAEILQVLESIQPGELRKAGPGTNP